MAHGAEECLDACRLLAEMIFRALEGKSQAEILASDDIDDSITSPSIASIARGAYRRKSAAEIKGSGYVVESLEAALWCFGNTGSFEGAILAAANLGDDADTTAAICGQVAGAFYGVDAIPESWRDRLAMSDRILELADGLLELSGRV